MAMGGQLWQALEGHPCEVYHAPFDVRLPEGGEDEDDVDTVVQPDIVVVCDPDKLDDRGCRGAPDFVIEIISPGSAAKDSITKAELYERHGVGEYWLVHPTDRLVTIRRLEEDGRYGTPEIIEGKGKKAVSVLEGVAIDLDAVFGNKDKPSEEDDTSEKEAPP